MTNGFLILFQNNNILVRMNVTHMTVYYVVQKDLSTIYFPVVIKNIFEILIYASIIIKNQTVN